MPDLLDPRHEALIEHLFRRAEGLFGFSGFELKPLRRRSRGKGKFHYLRLGYTKPGEKSMTVDLYTPRTMKPRKTDAILRVIAHEFAHHQEPPRRVRQWFRLVWMVHHPRFWNRYRANVVLMTRDELLGPYFDAARRLP